MTQTVPLAVPADFAPLSRREDMGLYSAYKIVPSDLRAFREAAECEHLPIISLCLAGVCLRRTVFAVWPGGVRYAFPGVVARTVGAYVVGLTEQDHFGIPAQFFFHCPHVFGKFTAVALSLKIGKAHAVMCSDPVCHIVMFLSYTCGSSIIFESGPRSVLLSVSASAILMMSGMIKGTTHQPSTVASPMGPVDLIYTDINHTVPVA